MREAEAGPFPPPPALPREGGGGRRPEGVWLSVVVAAYNETRRLPETLRRVLVRDAAATFRELLAIRRRARTARRQARFVTGRRIATDLDAMDLPLGSVLLDDLLGLALPLNSRNPLQFVTRSDPDFPAVLSDPAASGVLYILVPRRSGPGLLDAVNHRHPTFYADGAGMGSLVREYESRDGGHWRLYRLRPPPPPALVRP